MNKVRITAIRQTVYEDLIAKYENPIEHACDVKEGQQWISVDGKCPLDLSLAKVRKNSQYSHIYPNKFGKLQNLSYFCTRKR